MNALKDIYDIHYVKDARLNFLVTNEYGEELRVRRPTGGTIRFMIRTITGQPVRIMTCSGSRQVVPDQARPERRKRG